MAKVRTVVHTCDRCPVGRERPSAETVRFTYDGETTELDLCTTDAAAFHRDMQAWARLGRNADTSFVGLFDGRRQNDQARAATLRSRQAERDRVADLARIRPTNGPEPELESLPPSAAKWRISQHAMERMKLRGYTKREVLLAATDPEIARPSDQRKGVPPGSFMHTRGEVVAVCHKESRTVLTVYHRDHDRFTGDHAAQLRKA